jgi:hypothetical protein
MDKLYLKIDSAQFMMPSEKDIIKHITDFYPKDPWIKPQLSFDRNYRNYYCFANSLIIKEIQIKLSHMVI